MIVVYKVDYQKKNQKMNYLMIEYLYNKIILKI